MDKIVIKTNGAMICADPVNQPGTPIVGYGDNAYEALVNLLKYNEKFKIEVVIDEGTKMREEPRVQEQSEIITPMGVIVNHNKMVLEVIEKVTEWIVELLETSFIVLEAKGEVQFYIPTFLEDNINKRHADAFQHSSDTAMKQITASFEKAGWLVSVEDDLTITLTADISDE